jgi:hypothetical protein
MDGEWVETIMRKMIYEVVVPRIKHPTLVEKANVKPYSKNDMAHMMLKLEYVFPFVSHTYTTMCDSLNFKSCIMDIRVW